MCLVDPTIHPDILPNNSITLLPAFSSDYSHCKRFFSGKCMNVCMKNTGHLDCLYKRPMLSLFYSVRTSQPHFSTILLCAKELSVTASFMAARLSLSAVGSSCSSVMFTLPPVLSTINHKAPQGPHNSNVTPCQSITALILRTGEVSGICRRSELVSSPTYSSWNLPAIASVHDYVDYFGGGLLKG